VSFREALFEWLYETLRFRVKVLEWRVQEGWLRIMRRRGKHE